MGETIIAVLALHKRKMQIDIQLPLDMTANELIVGLNEGFNLGEDTADLSKCCLKTENPIALLRGNRTLREYSLRDGTVIQYTL